VPLLNTVRAFLRLAPLALGSAAASSGPAEQDLSIRLLNEYSRPSASQPAGLRHWTLVGAPTLVPSRSEGACCRLLANATREDSLSHVGVQIEASRGFTAEVRVYSNLGQFVDRISFAVPQSQFDQLAPGSRHNTRMLRILWDSHTEDGTPAGTGAYVLKTRVTLDPVPGVVRSGTLTRIDYRIVALLRKR
jgi:hypothetical protein